MLILSFTITPLVCGSCNAVFLLYIYIYIILLSHSLVTCSLVLFGNMLFGATDRPTFIEVLTLTDVPTSIEVPTLTDVPKLTDVPTLTEVSFLTVFGRQVTNTTCSRNLQDIQHLLPSGAQSIAMAKMYDKLTSSMQAAGLTPVMDR